MRCTVLPAKNADGTKLSADEVRTALRAINPDPPSPSSGAASPPA
jgi:hypothetical protein